jgi:hypothetical protein
MKTELLYKSSIEKLAENAYILRESLTVQLYSPYVPRYGKGLGSNPFSTEERWRRMLSEPLPDSHRKNLRSAPSAYDSFLSNLASGSTSEPVKIPRLTLGSVPKPVENDSWFKPIKIPSIPKIEPMKPTETFVTNIDHILKNLREIDKFHPAKPEPLHDQLFGIKGEHGKVLEFIHNNQPVEDPSKILRKYLDKPKI